MIRGLTDVVIGARSGEAWKRLLVDRFGFELAARSPDEGRIGQGANALLFVQRGVDSGRIRVIEFPDALDRPYPVATELGYFDFDIYTHDLASLHGETKDEFPWRSAPRAWTIAGTPVTLTQGLLEAPDFVNIVPTQGQGHVTWSKAWALEPDRKTTEVSSAIALVSDIDASIHFWHDALGMDKVGDFTLNDPALDELIGLPDGTEFRMAVMSSPDSTARVELIELPIDQIDRSNDSQPGALGIIAWGFRTDALDMDMERIIAGGGKLEHSIIEVDDEIHGKARTVAMRTFDNNLIELWQPEGEPEASSE